jgi:hypothetical protein
MAKAKEIIIQESMEELQKYLRKASCQTIRKRIKMLIVIKKRAPEMLSKNELAKLCKCNHNSINSWRRLYLSGGMDAITGHRWTGTKSKHISEEQHQQMAEKLNNPANGLVGYKELLSWVESEFEISMKYTTLYEYTRRNFKTKIKVTRKSHVRKSEEDLTVFKKKPRPSSKGF